MARRRSEVARSPSRAQWIFLTRFEEAYFSVKGHTLDTLPLGEPSTEERRKPEGWVPGVPRRTYLDWRSQKSSPRIVDLEQLCALVGERQTLLIDPTHHEPSQQGAESMDWYDKALGLIGQIAALSPTARGEVIAELRRSIQDRRAEEAANPLEPAEVFGSRPGRRSR